MEGDTRPHFRIDLRTPDGVEVDMGIVPFTGLEEACCDVLAAVPEAAAELLRGGVDPMRCAYLIRDVEGALLVELPFADLVRDRSPAPAAEARDGAAAVDPLLARSAQLRARSADAQSRAFASSERWRSALASLQSALGDAVLHPGSLLPFTSRRGSRPSDGGTGNGAV